MIDLEEIRQKADEYRKAVRTKRVPLDLDALLNTANERKALKQQADALRCRRNELTALVKVGKDREQNIEAGRKLGEEIKDVERRLEDAEKKFQELAALLPSLPDKETPEGETDADNVEIKKWHAPPTFDYTPKDHLELARLHKMVNFEGAREIAGSRAYALLGTGALFELAVLQLALAHVVAKGFTPVLPPLMVNHRAMFGTGYFPLGEDSAYHLEKDNLYLTGTSEVGAVAIHTSQNLELERLPLRYAGISPCFRREAGAAGRDTKGFYRVHQFQKVEQIVFCINDPEASRAEHEALLLNAEEILQALELPYRVVAVCTGDMGLGQVRKHDIETWMPSRNAYSETHSCSTFFDFQARRLNISYKDQNGQRRFVHTLNNTAIASPRILIPLMENHQLKDGSIEIPKPLQPFLNGREVLEPN